MECLWNIKIKKYVALLLNYVLVVYEYMFQEI